MNKLNLLILFREKSLKNKQKKLKIKEKKKIKAIQDKIPIKSIDKFVYGINDSPIALKEKKIYNKLTEQSFEKINNLEEKVDTNELVFKYKGNTPDEDCSKFDNDKI